MKHYYLLIRNRCIQKEPGSVTLNYIYSEVPPGLNFLLRPDYCHDKEIERCIKQNRKGNTPEVAAPDELDTLHAPNAEATNPSLVSRPLSLLYVASNGFA